MNCTDPDPEEEESESEQEEEEEQEEEQDQPPTNISVVEWKQRKKQKQERIAREQEELRKQEAEDHRRQKELEESHGSRKKKKKKQRKLESDEEESYKSVPRSEEYLHSQKHQRISNHPNCLNMGGNNTTKKKRAARPASTSNKKAKQGRAKAKRDEDYEDDTTVSSTLGSGSAGSGSGSGSFDEDLEAKRKWCEAKLKEMMRLASEKRRKRTEMVKFIESKAKHQLFKKTKFTHGDPYKKDEAMTKLEKDSEWLLNHINPDDYRKFDDFPKLQQEYVDCWIKLYKDVIRVGLNKKHNDVRSSILDCFAKIPDAAGAEQWNPDNLPVKGKEMEDLLFNRGFAKKEPNREDNGKKLAAITDLLMPNVRKSGA